LLPKALGAEAALRSRVAHQGDRVEQLLAELSSLQALEDSAAGIRERLVNLAPMLVGGATANEATAELGTLLRAQVEAEHAHLERVVVTPDSVGDGPLRRISARIELETDATGLEQLLTRLAGSEPIIVVDALQVTATEPATAGTVERLRISAQVRAWWLSRRPAGPDTIAVGQP
jgi:hypothetical protein